MDRDGQLVFADHIGRFFVGQYGCPPAAGRLLGYLLVCEPMQQSIGELADALLASRSAVTGAVDILETMKLVVRTRPAGRRFDLIGIAPRGWERSGFDSEEYSQLADLAREGLALLAGASPERRASLEEIRLLAEFLVERMPALYREWQEYLASRSAGGKETS